MCKTPSKNRSDLRIASIVRGKKVNIQVNGQPIEAHEGETIHAALTAAGIRSLKAPSGHRQTGRGVFCGMGICYECLVTVNQRPDQRACMTLVQDQMEIVTHES